MTSGRVGGTAAEYHLLTVWHIDAPLPAVYDAIYHSLLWPEWWPGAKKVETIADGDGNDIDIIRRYSWQGDLPYPVEFDVRATRIEPWVLIEGSARGDLEGTGRWHFSRDGETSVVRYEWHVLAARWWMNLLAPLARSIFIQNHVRIMTQGGEGLARRLGARLISQQNVDLTAKNEALGTTSAHLWEGGRIDLRALLIVGIGAGTLATFAQIALWQVAGMPVFETLFRDARLTAALVMGPAVLPPPATAQWDIVLVATVIHFALSISYALLPALLAPRLPAATAVGLGALYGLGIYDVNMYGFTVLFPWFSVARDWVTLLTHVVFGMALTGGCNWFAHRAHESGTAGSPRLSGA